MLRRPSACYSVRREEGCSSTAFAEEFITSEAVWINLAGRGSASLVMNSSAALP